MKSMYQLAAGHIRQHAGLALSFFFFIILKRGFCHSWMLCFHLSQSAATNAVNETIVNKSGGNMWAAAGSLDSERGRSKNLKKGQFVKKETKDFNCGFEHMSRNVELSCWQGFVCMCCRWTHPCSSGSDNTHGSTTAVTIHQRSKAKYKLWHQFGAAADFRAWI